MIHAMIAGKSAPPEACGRANRVTNALISASFTAQAEYAWNAALGRLATA
jgi:hypothetical protein